MQEQLWVALLIIHSAAGQTVRPLSSYMMQMCFPVALMAVLPGVEAVLTKFYNLNMYYNKTFNAFELLKSVLEALSHDETIVCIL